jgi:hypothetical protein
MVNFTESFPSISNDELDKLEGQTGWKLSIDYRNFLLKHNGGSPTPDVFSIQNCPYDTNGIIQIFFGIQPDEYNNLLDFYKRYKDWIPTNSLPIARDGCGNLLYMLLGGRDKGNIYFWIHDQEMEGGSASGSPIGYFVADSIDDLLGSLEAF